MTWNLRSCPRGSMGETDIFRIDRMPRWIERPVLGILYIRSDGYASYDGIETLRFCEGSEMINFKRSVA